jgi:hypothetical protein
MAHWQFREGNKVTASEYNQLAQMLRHCIAGSKLRIDSLLDVDPKVFVPLYRGWFESRYGRLPSPDATADSIGWTAPKRSEPLHCFWPPMTAASWPASN